MIAVSHDPQLLAAFDRVLMVDQGRVVREGPFEVLREDALCRNLLHEPPTIMEA